MVCAYLQHYISGSLWRFYQNKGTQQILVSSTIIGLCSVGFYPTIYAPLKVKTSTLGNPTFSFPLPTVSQIKQM